MPRRRFKCRIRPKPWRLNRESFEHRKALQDFFWKIVGRFGGALRQIDVAVGGFHITVHFVNPRYGPNIKDEVRKYFYPWVGEILHADSRYVTFSIQRARELVDDSEDDNEAKKV